MVQENPGFKGREQQQDKNSCSTPTTTTTKKVAATMDSSYDVISSSDDDDLDGDNGAGKGKKIKGNEGTLGLITNDGIDGADNDDLQKQKENGFESEYEVDAEDSQSQVSTLVSTEDEAEVEPTAKDKDKNKRVVLESDRQEVMDYGLLDEGIELQLNTNTSRKNNNTHDNANGQIKEGTRASNNADANATTDEIRTEVVKDKGDKDHKATGQDKDQDEKSTVSQDEADILILSPPPKKTKKVVEIEISDDDDDNEREVANKNNNKDKEKEPVDTTTLNLECIEEPLSKAQVKRNKLLTKEMRDLDNKLQQIKKKSIIYNILPVGASIYGLDVRNRRPTSTASINTNTNSSYINNINKSNNNIQSQRMPPPLPTAPVAPRTQLRPPPMNNFPPPRTTQTNVRFSSQQQPQSNFIQSNQQNVILRLPPPQVQRTQALPPRQIHPMQTQQQQQIQNTPHYGQIINPQQLQQQQQQQQQMQYNILGNDDLRQLFAITSENRGFTFPQPRLTTTNVLQNQNQYQHVRLQTQNPYASQQPTASSQYLALGNVNIRPLYSQNLQQQQQPPYSTPTAPSLNSPFIAQQGLGVPRGVYNNTAGNTPPMINQNRLPITGINRPPFQKTVINRPVIQQPSFAPRSLTRPNINQPLQPLSRPTIANPIQQNSVGIRAAALATNVSLSSSLMMTSEQETAQEINPGTINGPSNAIGTFEKDSVKTFPSLVVIARACLLDKPSKDAAAAARNDLDQRMKSLLILEPSKLTEYLMQRGLLRLEHKCNVHKVIETNMPVLFKLGMYSEGGKQPFSGGYVWLADCCPEKQISVFTGSIFESSPYSPSSLLKLIYHWACQTSSSNIVAWVKVTNFYLKNFYTLLRSICVGGLQEFCPIMGGKGKFVEIGIITLGTTLQGQKPSKQVKVEILGVFDPNSKVIRMKVINPNNNLSIQNATHNRVIQILQPLNDWVNKESTILIDSSIDKSLLKEMGFTNVLQTPSGDKSINTGVTPSNINVMNYLKHVVPKMFQNTLCVLSKCLVQQFLDELAWREIWGLTANDCFENILKHMVSMTKWDQNETLISRLNKVSTNPFEDWRFTKKRASVVVPLPPPTHSQPSIEDLPDSIRGTNLMDLISPTLYPNNMNKRQAGVGTSSNNKSTLLPQFASPITDHLIKGNTANKNNSLKRKHDSEPPPPIVDLGNYLRSEIKNLTLEVYYYASAEPEHNSGKVIKEFPNNLKCPLCSKPFTSNQEIMRHICMHVNSLARTNHNVFCEYCLKDIGPPNMLNQHILDYHKMKGPQYQYCCRICQENFNSETNFILHMWETHQKWEMPYCCEICSYRSSFHYELTEHYNKTHGGCAAVLCTMCLKVLPCKTLTCVKDIVVHIQSHAIRKGKKCPQCNLDFWTDSNYRAHLSEGAHHSGNDSSKGMTLIPYALRNDEEGTKMARPPNVGPYKILPPPLKKSRVTSLENNDSSPKKLTPPVDALGNYQIIEHHPIKNLAESTGCLECEQNISNADHYPGFMNCLKCRFSTSCKSSMEIHQYEVHLSGGKMNQKSGIKNLMPPEMLPTSMICTCGFRTKNGYRLAFHLSQCKKTTAFPVPTESNTTDTQIPHNI